MTKRIRTYNDLVEEKQQLTLLLQAQKQLVRADLAEIKQELIPVKSAISFVSKMTTRDSSNWIMNKTANSIIDLVVKKLILARSGWLTKLAVPFFLKNVSSHVIADHKNQILGKLFSWVGKKNANGQEKHVVQEEEEED
ncbi:MAG: hypothetical protein WDN26_00615 [Chitinophagaceae bacterium]